MDVLDDIRAPKYRFSYDLRQPLKVRTVGCTSDEDWFVKFLVLASNYENLEADDYEWEVELQTVKDYMKVFGRTQELVTIRELLENNRRVSYAEFEKVKDALFYKEGQYRLTDWQERKKN